jgi:hypothetical protein
LREMASPEPSAAGAGAGGESASQATAVEPIRMPTAEEIKGQDIWNNCAVRSVVSGVMGETLLLSPGAPALFPFLERRQWCFYNFVASPQRSFARKHFDWEFWDYVNLASNIMKKLNRLHALGQKNINPLKAWRLYGA